MTPIAPQCRCSQTPESRPLTSTDAMPQIKGSKRAGVSRSVRASPYAQLMGASKSGKQVRTGSNVLGPLALIRERQKAEERYNLNTAGLSEKLLSALAEIRGELPTSVDTSIPPELVDDVATGADDNEWEDIPDDTTIVYALRDIIGSRWKNRWYKDARTWRQRIQNFHDNWQPLIPSLINAYLAWKYRPSAPTVPPTTAPSSYDFEIDVLDFYSTAPTAYISRTADSTSAAEALLLNGYMSATPISPNFAVSLPTLELFHCLRLFKPSFSTEAFAKLLCYYYMIPYRRRFRAVIADTFDIYLVILRGVNNQVQTALGRNSPDWRVLNACPACSYKLKDEPKLRFGRMYCVDGNNSLKRIAQVGNRVAGDTRIYGESDYFLSKEYVDRYANEVPAERPPATTTDSQDPPSGDDGDPTDGVTAEDAVSRCTKNWKAAAADENKRMWAIFDETGIFASSCRHGLILWVCDMVRSGELAKYPLAIVSKALELLGPEQLGGYDIGCSFEGTLTRSSLGPEFRHLGCRFCVNAFHGDKYMNVRTMLYNNYIQALKIVNNESIAVEEAKKSLNISDDDMKRWQEHERAYFGTLGQELPWDIHAMAYVESLQELVQIRAQLDRASTQFLTTMPTDYQFVAVNTTPDSYSANMSVTRKLEMERRHLLERHGLLNREVCAMEAKMGIANRWQPSTPEYMTTVKYIATRDYHRALDNLQRLVILRLFELHKLNLSQTTYRVRTHIAKALQTRCKAIRNAVQAYNTAALALDPPCPTLDWSKVSHYTFLDEFNLLRNTRNDIREQPWAQPAIRETMKLARRVDRAREELEHCNVEIRRVHTSILDEEDFFTAAMAQLKHDKARIFGAVEEFCMRRSRINAHILACLHRIHRLSGFTGNPSRGERAGASSSIEVIPRWSESSSANSTTAPASDLEPLNVVVSAENAELQLDETAEHVEDEDDDDRGDIGGLVDYLSGLPTQGL
ncbi:hypothetical protein A0H81_02986 [Grifola frondosa]|uniref:CxC1-like cysteine cluster associated with KDZ transposases domain-containing protein n=1 Tax=Grifola frondosa TaxID=5627 RepID=A0A1C7MJE4_GRIFR|nr:hypothetical protein A0H81_02986 [Grifola frondosa]